MAHEVLEIRDDVIRVRLSGLLNRTDMTALQELALQGIGISKHLLRPNRFA